MKYLITLLFIVSFSVNAQTINQSQNQVDNRGATVKTTKVSKPTVRRTTPTNKQNQKQQQQQAQQQGQKQGQKQNATATASNSGNDQSINSNFEASAPDIILIPNNNTSNCMKVYGLSFSNTSGGGGIGLPYRDAACDFESAADDAAAGGNQRMAWYWRCHKKNIYKTFKTPHVTKAEAIQGCAYKMWQMLEPRRSVPVPVVTCEHDDTHGRIFKACQEK